MILGKYYTFPTFDKPVQITKGAHTTKFRYGPSRSRFYREDISTNGTEKTWYLGSVEKVIKPNGTVEWRRYLAGGGMYTYTTNASGSETAAVKKRFLLKDHLGSTDVIVDHNGSVIQNMSFDPWGQRRNATNWSALSASAITSFMNDNTTKGFTGHEMLDEVGFIHMNGRIYDPRLGRFMQADPFVQAPTDTQSLNRYTYLRNNPLNATDPSGYFAFTLAAAFYLAATKVTEAYIIGLVIGLASAADALAQGATLGQAIKTGIISGVSAAAFASFGSGFELTSSTSGGQLAAHAFKMGAIGGVTSVLQGGKFGHGFASAGVGAIFGAGIDADLGSAAGPGAAAARVISRAVVGGTMSEATGGKFANGAATAAFSAIASEIGTSDTLNHDGPHAKNSKTVDGKPATGRGSFSDETLADIDSRVESARARWVGKSKGAVDKTAIALSQDAELTAISEEYIIEVGVAIRRDGTVAGIKTNYHHSRVSMGSLKKFNIWHTHPGLTERNFLGIERQDLRRLSGGDMTVADGNGTTVYARYNDGSLLRYHGDTNPLDANKSITEIYDRDSGSWNAFSPTRF